MDNLITPLLKLKYSGKIRFSLPFRFNLHKGTPFFLTSPAEFYAKSGDFLKQNEIIGTIHYEQIIIGDIIQGLPKIEKFFEAKKPKISGLLNSKPCFVKKLEKLKFFHGTRLFCFINNNVNFFDITNCAGIRQNQFLSLGHVLTKGLINPHNLLITYFKYYIKIGDEFDACYISFKNIQFLLIEKILFFKLCKKIIIFKN